MKQIVILILIFFGSLQAKEYKALFDCSSGDAYYLKTRMFLINKTVDMIEAKGDTTDFVMTMHGDCAVLASQNYEDVVEDNDLPDIGQAQEYLKAMIKEKRLKVVTCEMSLKRNAIDKKEVLSSIDISPNSYIDAIAYQNDGYAIMTFK